MKRLMNLSKVLTCKLTQLGQTPILEMSMKNTPLFRELKEGKDKLYFCKGKWRRRLPMTTSLRLSLWTPPCSQKLWSYLDQIV